MPPFGLYIHVPFCAVRCGYCDFNTYAPGEADGATPEGYVAAALQEMEMAASHPGFAGRTVTTVFFGGGTPTLLPVAALARLLETVRRLWGLADDAEVTTEANPDSVSAQGLAELAAAGFTRVSFGMQSSVPHVLRTLDRTHDPLNVARAVQWAKDAGLQVSLDLIYGTPGESLEDWQRSLDTAIAMQPDHVSAYSLVIEPGTRMGAQLRRGEVSPTDPGLQAQMYEAADACLSAAGYDWYEVSNWARTPEHRCRHNLGYWRGDDWWGVGPGAHSYVSPGVIPARRWWNVKHPRAYAQRLSSGEVPVDDQEVLTPEQVELERVMLGVRLREGIPIEDSWRDAVHDLAQRGLLDPHAAEHGIAALTLKGRLLADAVVRELTR